MSEFKHTHSEPNPQEREILYHLIEECSEVIQRATKVLRFGTAEVQSGQSLDNVERLSEEVGNLKATMAKAESVNLLDEACINYGFDKKVKKFEKYSRFSNEDGAGHA